MIGRFNVQVATSVTEIGREEWDSLVDRRPFASYRWYCFGEKVLDGVRPFYIILSQAGKSAACGTFWLDYREPLPISSRVTRTVMQSILRRWPLLDCRTPLVNYSGLMLPDDPVLRDDALTAISQTAQAIAHTHRASFVLLDYLNLQPASLRLPDGFQSVSIGDPATLLEVRWPDFESYLAQMSKSMRKDYHRHYNRAGDLEIDVRIQPRVTRIAEALPLIRQVERHHHTAPDPYIPRVLEHSALVDACWLTAEVDQRLVGCGLLLGDGGVWTLTALGLDYSVKFVYFQLLYAAIRSVIESQSRFLYGGSGANDLKQRLGFSLLRNNDLAVAANQWIFRQITKRLA